MSEYEPVVDEVMRDLTAKLREVAPEFGDVLDATRDMTETEAVEALLVFQREHPEVVQRIEAFALSTLEATRALMRPSDIVIPPPSGVGLPRLDPAYEAYLQERIQFDGDIPEMRFGAIPQEARPAVPVDTSALDPVVVGMMLDAASREVADEVGRIEAERVETVTRLLEGATEEEAALVLADPATLVKLDRDSLPDPVGYERGQVPALRQVAEPEGWGLMTLTPEQRQQYAWKTLSTTQGRRSMVRVIRDLLSGGLRNDGYVVDVSEGELRSTKPGEVRAYAEWTMNLTGPNATQASFAFADVAWRSLLHTLEDAVTPEEGALTLEVATVNMVDVRRVGFCARLLRRQE